ncbi:MAG: hypothetical protein GTO45_09125, partial [Candidatus Aminicenantes bacterium]|nr:hypothetical protein [Candidatus Aminicenantes bacterium]NIM78995.1 hypothetical protein [Candidatus Aminicenantes bacterium]NIN18253.1 hypothetical protein [Candidatus Aminicenantes bacterium]NIN42150.1 hypothetical protein [Candidatus Aminicenantes bacterium]NIN84906.1 hypothetical protein [Candidatus Aminicenantes bacterium]
MKKMILVLVVLAIGFFPGVLVHGNLNITKVGEWGTGYYKDVFIQGNYAYCAADYAGVDIIDISDPANPRRIANYDTPCHAYYVYVSGNYAYVGDHCGGLQVLGVANPSAPYWVGSYDMSGNYVGAVSVQGNYAYIVGSFSGNNGFEIIDVSNASSPTFVASYNVPDPPGAPYLWSINDISVDGDYVYLAVLMGEGYSPSYGELHIVDVSTPSSPVFAGKYTNLGFPRSVTVENTTAYVTDSSLGLLAIDVSNFASPALAGSYITTGCRGIDISGNYAYVSMGGQGLQVLDVSNPANPTLAGSCDTPGFALTVDVSGNSAYVADEQGGLQIINISTPAAPTSRGAYDASEAPLKVYVRGSYAYLLNEYEGLVVLDVSSPSSPSMVFRYDTPVPQDVYVNLNYAYVADKTGLYIIDMTNPTSAAAVGHYAVTGYQRPHGVDVMGNYAYVADIVGLRVIDISNPSNPTLAGGLDIEASARRVDVDGNYAYVTYDNTGSGVLVVDISNPSSPKQVGKYEVATIAWDVNVIGNYAYVPHGVGGLTVLDVSDRANPVSLGNYQHQDYLEYYQAVCVSGNYAYVSGANHGLHVINIANPYSPTLAGSYDVPWASQDVYFLDNYVYLLSKTTGKLHILRVNTSGFPPQINVNRFGIKFGAEVSGVTTGAQTLFISNVGGGTLNWSITVDANWLVCSPVSGSGSGEVTVSINPVGLSPGTYNGTITISDPNAGNSPQTVEVTLEVVGSGQTAAPFGFFATPGDATIVRSSIPVTGWALDDIGVQSVQIFREENDGVVYIGDAVFVEGARPDVEQSYPTYPNNYKAGWGYMMLTNFLPGGGNGTFKIHAIATDMEGNQVILGTKTIICDNANAVKPFGAIDTPTQGGIASGSQFINYGWVLTPLPNTIPTDGSTIRIWVDGVFVGNPVYNQYRQDIADLFPGYNNSNGAVGYFYLDTTQYENGVHTIQWTAVDDAGNTDGIGSRYFTIRNTVENRVHSAQRTEGRGGSPWPPIDIIDISTPVEIKKGYNQRIKPKAVYPDEKGIISIEIKELERFEIHFFEPGHKNST